MLSTSKRLAFAANVSAAHSLPEMWKLRGDMPIPVKIGKAALIDIPAHSQSMRYMINRFATREFDGYLPLGGRGEQIVLVCGQKILKLVACLHEAEYSSLHEAAHRLQSETDICQQYFGKRWTPTNYDVVRGKKTGAAIITAAQPRVQADVSYKSVKDIYFDRRLDKIPRQELAESTRALYASTGLYPDLLGTDNIFGVPNGLGSRELQFIDTIPIAQPRLDAAYDLSAYTVRECIERELEILSSE